ncbi:MULTISPECIES: DUF2789 family protein [Pseudomonas]|jgi:hypothetical protein|uniref:DUF2789 domain-containing protein n=1 Tax=Pseudomonas bijieensis TaxID=2681983 RepID=A0A6N1C8J6_9PSED|nr:MULTISPECIES: DUF2789 family protein [Pseudomonas]AXP02856.1 DUF2789 family protein [Pseudomonas fluorescens]MCD9114539.1 DUF2789 domain-containing protein [Pseudomonas bijieensis]PWJ30019.1 uncharacterized protein DUF2789 [Pseudomonas sp. 43mfcvi1.1]QKS81499.1 DUF2789 domain-containing protein [Pseudomonas bijieensis]UQI33541.1 DUF2789 domain-containing protein [Pseudomonas bijieensis]
MEQPSYELNTLFAQLGLPSDDKAIDDFIMAHPLAPEIKLVEADFWSDQQKDLLQEWLLADGEEALLVDELNVRLHDGK